MSMTTKEAKELQNAEYSMMCKELLDFVKDCYNLDTNNQELSDKDREKLSCILSALTGSYDRYRLDLPKQTDSLVTTWENELSESKNEFVIGKYYIRISGMLLFFVSAAVSSGLMDDMITHFEEFNPAAFALKLSTNVVLGLVGWFQTIQSLEDDDFCVYMQAVVHYKKHKEFTKDELISWFPCGENPLCNMHDRNSKWDCLFLNNPEPDMCSILKQDNLNNAIENLEKKKLLKPVFGSGTKTYRFVI